MYYNNSNKNNYNIDTLLNNYESELKTKGLNYKINQLNNQENDTLPNYSQPNSEDFNLNQSENLNNNMTNNTNESPNLNNTMPNYNLNSPNNPNLNNNYSNPNYSNPNLNNNYSSPNYSNPNLNNNYSNPNYPNPNLNNNYSSPNYSNPNLNNNYSNPNYSNPNLNNNYSNPNYSNPNLNNNYSNPNYTFPSSDLTNPNYNCISRRELEHMEALYTSINKILMPYISQILDEYEYIGSPMYSYTGIDSESLAQLVDRVIILSRVSLDDVDEIYLDQNPNISIINNWDRWRLLRSNIESLLLTDIFTNRRPAYFKKFAPNIF